MTVQLHPAAGGPSLSLVEAAGVIAQDEAAARDLLRQHGLRATEPRLAVLQSLAEAEGPLSFTDLMGRGGTLRADRATVYRNLIRLCEVGIAVVAERLDGRDRYALASAHEGEHRHAHFLCQSCGRVNCLPAEVTALLVMDGPWGESIREAVVQLRGSCPDCRAAGRGD